MSARTSIQQTERLKRKHGIENLELQQLPVERAAELGRVFDHVICTGVLHHLPDPDRGLRALHDVLTPDGAMHLMVYAPYGRAGVYLLQDYCRRLGIGNTAAEIRELAASLQALPPDHPLQPLLRNAPDFGDEAGLADALLHPQDRAYSVPQVLDFLAAADLEFGRWVRQAAYLPQCGALASSPHQPLLARLPLHEQYAAVELFRGTMVRHSVVVYRRDRPQAHSVGFEGDAWLGYVPVRLPDTSRGAGTAAAGGRSRADQQAPYLHRHLPARQLATEETVRRHRWQAHDRGDRPAGCAARQRARVVSGALVV